MLSPEQARLDHLKGMAELKRELNTQILAGAGRDPDSVALPEPFRLTQADFDQERRRLIDGAEAAIRRGWQHIMAADQELAADAEYEDDSVTCHDQYVAEINRTKTDALQRIDEIQRLVRAFNDARMDIYNSLRRGDRGAALHAARSFVRLPAVIAV